MKSITKLIPFFALGLALALALSISIGQGLGQEAGTGGGPAAPDQPSSLYLPTASKAPNTIYGHVTDDGLPAVGVELDLWFYNGATWSSIMETTTDANGDYFFRDMPALAAGQKYGVEYFNVADPNRLYLWDTRQLDSFPNLSNVNIGNFDIANVELTSPVGKLLASLPGIFQWTPRPATPSDSYEFDVSGTAGVPEFHSGPLGYIGSYNLGSLPPSFNYCVPYIWYVNIFGPDGGSGTSFWAAWVTLYNAAPSGIHGCAYFSGAPASGIPVKLWRFTPPTTWNSWNATTNSRGYFAFTGRSTLNAGQFYYVEYTNGSNPNRLGYYESRLLTSYASGSSVHIGDFDIGDISLTSPDDEATVPLPATFNWMPRPSTPYDSYDFHLFDSSSFSSYLVSEPLGFMGEYTLASLPPGTGYGIPYGWGVGVWDPFGGWGASYNYRIVTFQSLGLSVAPVQGSGELNWAPHRLEVVRRAHTSQPETPAWVHPNLVRFRGQP